MKDRETRVNDEIVAWFLLYEEARNRGESEEEAEDYADRVMSMPV